MARLGLPRSAPGWFTVIFATLMIARQAVAFVDTQPVMDELNIRDENSVRAFALLLVLVNSYDFIGALEDNWAIYWFSLISRFFAAALFYWLGGGWDNFVPIELASAFVLAGCMWWSSRGDA
ncbi:hypothetical protein LTR36_006738 [Oleoguttula mirabilis]|uniref:DUF4345 domain-containing protein n=1 Tax=Oleoguttula mirabilis TaxID=1507867 RepID=A0AAV9JBH5_9PEZI|nr:hypothetical protein LTR36_006738 [Oleoguttula mirabilis]